MDLLSRALCVLCLVAALATFSKATKSSPCPDLFQYEGGEQPQQWDGTLKIENDEELQGLWIRVKFDNTVKEIIVHDDFGQVVSRSPKNDEYLIKNPDFILKPRTPTKLRITVKYDGNKVPSLIGYRLNARTVCPEQNVDPSESFQNDVNSKDFLSSVLYKRNPSTLPKFECGIASAKYEFPWQAAIFFKDGDKSRYLCEGTLITPKHVLTAAHCVTYEETGGRLAPTLLSLSFGKSDLSNEEKSKQESGVASINVYPGYKFTNILNDIAVIELNEPVAVGDFVRPICLSEGPGEESKKTVVVGYALDKSLNVGSKLESTEVKEIKAAECEKRLPELSPLIGDNSYCAAFASDESRCVGDSGSSVASLRKSNVWELRGIVTLGVALQNKYVCNQSATVILTDVSKYLRWIRESTL